MSIKFITVKIDETKKVLKCDNCDQEFSITGYIGSDNLPVELFIDNNNFYCPFCGQKPKKNKRSTK